MITNQGIIINLIQICGDAPPIMVNLEIGHMTFLAIGSGMSNDEKKYIVDSLLVNDIHMKVLLLL